MEVGQEAGEESALLIKGSFNLLQDPVQDDYSQLDDNSLVADNNYFELPNVKNISSNSHPSQLKAH